MLSYEGQPCILCGKPFTESDDIVVCPDCGTPYHRACYRENGACINTVLHETGQSWMEHRQKELRAERRAEKAMEQEMQADERERAGGQRDGMASLFDGVRLNPNDPCVGLDPDEEYDGVTLSALADYVGQNRFYYLPLFRLMKKSGRHYSFNMLSLFFPELFFANRKMWATGLAALFLNLLLNIPYYITVLTGQMNLTIAWVDVGSDSFRRIYTVSGVVGLLLSIFFCLFSNYFYYKHAVKRVQAIKAQRRGYDEEAVSAAISASGGTSALNVVLMLLIKGAAIFTLLMLLMIL